MFLLIFSKFVKGKFLAHNVPRPDAKIRELYPFETTATDTDLVKNVFNTINQVILEKLIDAVGLN